MTSEHELTKPLFIAAIALSTLLATVACTSAPDDPSTDTSTAAQTAAARTQSNDDDERCPQECDPGYFQIWCGRCVPVLSGGGGGSHGDYDQDDEY